MTSRMAAVLGAGAVSLLAACGGGFGPGTRPYSGPEPGSSQRIGNAVVIDSGVLWKRGGDLLSIIASRVSSMQVKRSGRCPSIILRGQSTLTGPSNPKVYVNGQPAGDTCILESMRPEDVARVEVYPQGVTQRGGYPAHPFGLILVFLREAG